MSDQAEVLDEFYCGFCRQITTRPLGTGHPQECDHCKLKRCTCGAYCHDRDSYCYGCGKIRPELKASMTRVGSTASAYQSQGWIHRNSLERGCKFEIWHAAGPSRVSTLHKLEWKSGEWVETEVRQLTKEEVRKLKGTE